MLPDDCLTSEPPLPLLVTGLTGVAGYNAFEYFHRKHPGRVFAIRQVRNWPLAGPGILPCDAEDYQGLTQLFRQHRFQAVLNCAGNCALKSCELDPEMAYRINLSGVRNLLNVVAEQPQAERLRLVHVSIDLVFSGRGQGGYFESDVKDPVTIYGKSMAAAEHLVTLERPDAAIMRISLPMGISYSGHAGAIDWIQSRFKANKPATLYYDEVRTPTYTDCLNRVFDYALTHRIAGLFHTGGTRRLSLFQIAQIVNRLGGYDPDLLKGCYRVEAGPIPPRAGNVTMDSNKLTSTLGVTPFDPWPFYAEHVPHDRRWHFERPDGQPSSPEHLAEMLYHNPRPLRVHQELTAVDRND